MSGVPVDIVVELLMISSCSVEEDEGGNCYWIEISKNGDNIQACSPEELREGIREYLLTLVAKPKLLIECEEGVPYVAYDSAGWCDVVCRSGTQVTGYNIGRQAVALFGSAAEYQVIQPVEVPKSCES